MNPLNLFISSSDRHRPATATGFLYAGFWVLLSLVAIDFAINTVFAYPTDPKANNPTRMQSYFEYGRSSEGKLRRMTRADPEATAPITLAGWYDPLVAAQKKPDDAAPIVTFYGMSHAAELAYALERVTDKYTPRIVAAPGASANWAYGAYQRDRGGGKSRVVVLALMSVNLPMISAVSPMTWNIDFAMPYTADRFYEDGNGLRAVHPPFDSFKEYVAAFEDRQSWAEARAQIAANDSLYDPFIMRETVLDHSAFVRLIRRAYGQRLQRSENAGVLNRAGFNADSEQVKLARIFVQKFAEAARADGMIPVIYLVNNLGYGDQLFRALQPTLESNNIPFLSSHTVASPSDPRKYVPNSHFTPAIDEDMARALIRVIEQQTTGKANAS